MLSLDSEIDQALKADTVLTGLIGTAIYEFNDSLTEDIPDKRIIYEEISNVPAGSADDVEQASRITYRVSVCAESNLTEIINAVERVMVSINFVRQSAEIIRGLPLGIKGKVIQFITLREVI